MDYTQVFKNLNTSRVKRKHSPHKAVLLLALMELFEENKITENKFVYDDSLKTRFHQIWNRFLIDDETFQAIPHLPFWFLSSDGFWHIVPTTGNQYIVQAFLQARVKISESKLLDIVSHATLDEDLYFQFSMPTSRKEFRKILLLTYLYLSEAEIAEYLNERSNYNSKKEDTSVALISYDDEEQKFHELNEDLQISLNIEYYTFLRDNRELRQQFKEICPSPAALYKNIAIIPIKKGQLDGFFEYSYSSFLRDMSLSLMSNDYAVSFVETIDKAVEIIEGMNSEYEDYAEEENSTESYTENTNSDKSDVRSIQEIVGKNKIEIDETLYHSIPEYLQNENEHTKTPNRKGQPWSDEEEEQIKQLYYRGYSYKEIAESIGRTVLAIKMRLSVMGVVKYEDEELNDNKDEEKRVETTKEESKAKNTNTSGKEIMTGDDFFIENRSGRCYIYNNKARKVFTSTGKIKIINGTPYKVLYLDALVTINEIAKTSRGTYIIGDVVTRATRTSDLYVSLPEYNYLGAIEDIHYRYEHSDYIVKVEGRWYDKRGALTKQ